MILQECYRVQHDDSANHDDYANHDDSANHDARRGELFGNKGWREPPPLEKGSLKPSKTENCLWKILTRIQNPNSTRNRSHS